MESAGPLVAQDLDFSSPDAELVFGVVCAAGGNYRKIEKHLGNVLRTYGYTPNTIRLSDCIADWVEDLDLIHRLEDGSEYLRVLSRMEAGNEARQKTGKPELLTISAISKINSRRSAGGNRSREPMPRTAHILLTLKRPEEVDVLRKVYGPGFFLVGVFATEGERIGFLRDDHGLSEEEAKQLIRKDEEDPEVLGQQTRNTFHRADVFVRLSGNGYKRQLQRFLNLVFRHPFHTPTRDEHSMFLAFAASLRSAQLGRQVGASVAKPNGDLIAVGCNEVPCAGGGSYWEGTRGDARDHHQGQDSNDVEKRRIAEDICQKLGPLLKDGTAGDALALLQDSRVFEITEFGRAVHAEMDAILSAARSGIPVADAILYTTTFPCHNCTRHIIAAGISRVVYIEPYPKSKARELHEDAIRIDETESGRRRRKGRVPFEPFVGIGPRRYADLFSVASLGSVIDRKADDGKVARWNPEGAGPRVPMQPVSYLQREQLVANELTEILKRAKERNQ